ncbi:MAG: glucose-6-phosphate isomerase [Alphaproteobacteria bacterium BRH_c36]|nr:MAG: glucose-6-phosphate isomerase [Alphaproteobacteria bacterium BRH_c36]
MAQSPTCDGVSAYRLDIAGCLSGAIGEHGLNPSDLEAACAQVEPGFRQMQAEARDGSLPVLKIAGERDDLAAANSALEGLSKDARVVIFFGTGGSGLGGQALAQLAGWNIAGVAMPGQIKRPRTRFYDNLDPSTLNGLLTNTDLATARFVITSKSGGTAETLAQAIATLSAVKAAGLEERIPQMFLGITEEAVPGRNNGLRSLLAAHNVAMLPHPDDIGGRFSCLTIVGLIAAIARGLDAVKIRQGAQDVIDQLAAALGPADCPAALSAAVSVAMSKQRGARVLVLMPYADRLGYLARWFVQLWAESLGKAGEGTTPIAAMGPLDQHSQLQLFMDGPRDHLVTLMRLPTSGTGPAIDAGMARLAGADYMAGRAVGDVVAAQAAALPAALANAGRPVRTIDIHSLDEWAIGGVMMHFMIETILAGRMLGIDPFDQPAVELAKVLTRERLVQPMRG